MAAVQMRPAPIDAEPEENWDDDFELQSDPSCNRGSRTSRKNSGNILFTPKLSIGSRAETEDWDADEDAGATRRALQHAAQLATSTSTLKPQTLSPASAIRSSPRQETENWDDDFENARNSPQKATHSSFPPLASSLLHSADTSPASHLHAASHGDDPPESWDDDLELNDAEFGLAEHEEEDRTVTARSRRAALARTAARAPAMPPPPTPQLPRGLAGVGAFLAPDPPFPHAQTPHSPMSSVFSVPATVRTTGSGVPLFGASAAGVGGRGGGQAYPSASARVFSLLPPSPQVHKERERRRLRKRSRPGEREERDRRRERDGVFELVEVAEGRASGSGGAMWDDEYGYGYGRRSMDSERGSEMDSYEERSTHGHVHPPLPAQQPPATRPQATGSGFARPSTAPTGGAPPPSSMGSSAQIQSVPATPSKHSLLSRIGSVKRWAGAEVRRRRGMSTGPEEVAGGSRYTDTSNDPSDTHRTPRPQSSLSSFTNHDSNSSYSHHLPAQPHNANKHPYDHRRHSAAPPRSPPSPSAPSRSPQENRAGSGGDGGWFFRPSSRTSSTTGPGGPARRAFRSASRSQPADTSNGASPAASAGSRGATVSPPPSARRKPSRSGSRAESPRTPHRGTGDGDGGAAAATPSPQHLNGVGVGRRPSSRATQLDGRKSMRASLDFNASRTSLGMSMNILEAQEQRERAAVGRGRGYSVGGKEKDTEKEGGKESEERTPAKLIKRKSLGFVQLGRAVAAGYSEEVESSGAAAVGGKNAVEDEGQGEGRQRQAKYGGLGIGRAFGLGRSAEGAEGETDERKRRKSFSRFLKDGGKDKQGSLPALPQTPSKDKDKEGSRGFMGSVRRISLVGEHKRTKSGSGLGLGSVPPSPSSPFFSRHASSGTPASGRGEVPPVPYALPPLPASSASQLSLRLPSSSSPNYLPLPPHPLALDGKRIVSTASSQSQGSSVLPASSSSASTQASTSANSSRSPSTNLPQSPECQPQKTPTQPHQQHTPRRPSSRRSRASEEGARRPSLASARPSIDFEARIRRSIDQEISEGGKEDGQAGHSQRRTSATVSPRPEPPVPPVPLLPPIELQPPSPPQTISPAASGTGQKPAPLQADAMVSGSLGATLNTVDSLSPATSSSSLFFTPTSSPPKPSSPTKLGVSQSPSKSPASQQSASLGRVTAATAVAATEASGQGSPSVPRRNSLGDLKIPARISQAQVGIKRDLGLVREFANSVDQLKELQDTYNGLVAEIQAIFESHIQRHVRETPSPLPRTTSPSFFANLATKARPKSRARSNTNPTPGKIASSDSPSMQDVTTAQLTYKEMASAFYTINSKYRISWECAELLIELGGGTPSSATSPPPSSASVPMMMQAQAAAFDNVGKKRSRERAVTLAGDHSKPYSTASTSLVGSASLPTSPPHLNVSSPPPASPPNMSWRASTGRHDLSQRQLVLLREMLNNTNATSIADESHLSIPEESLPSLHSLHAANKDWRWGDARNSTITLPSEESGALHHDRYVSAEKKRKGGKLGMAGIRDMLRALKRNRTEGDAGILANYPPSTANNGPMTKVLHSTASLSTESSGGSKSHRYAHPRLPSNRRRAKTSTGPETVRASQDHDGEFAAASSFVNPSFAPKPSARRPSLASIFRIGNKHRTLASQIPDDPLMSVSSSSAVLADEHQAHSSGTGDDSASLSEEDWDRMDSASDLDAVAKALSAASDGTATVRGGSRRRLNKGRSPYLQPDSFEPPPSLPLPVPIASGSLSKSGYSMRASIIPKRSFNLSSSSLRNGEQSSQGSPHGSSHMPQRTIRLSNVEEHTDERTIPSDPIVIASPLRPSSMRLKPTKTGSVRSMPPQYASSGDPKLAMTPENIKPLLENAKEVLSKLVDCIAEIRALINVAAIDSDI